MAGQVPPMKIPAGPPLLAPSLLSADPLRMLDGIAALEGEYDWRLTQKLILQPRTEWTFYGKDDRDNGRGKGLSAATAGVRLRYEITRQIAPYIGVEWQKSFGRTGDFVRAAGGQSHQTRWVAGLSFWF